MRKKLAAMLAALLLVLSLLPVQALAAPEPDPVDPPAVTETGDTETPEEHDGTETPQSSAPKRRTPPPPPPEDPDLIGGGH